MLFGFLEIFLISIIISFIFKKLNLVKIWLTYIVSLIVCSILFYLSGDLDFKINSMFGFITIGMFVAFFILQLISNLLVIGKPFLKEKTHESSSDILDDNFIK
jgi:hypothetical protein